MQAKLFNVAVLLPLDVARASCKWQFS